MGQGSRARLVDLRAPAPRPARSPPGPARRPPAPRLYHAPRAALSRFCQPPPHILPAAAPPGAQHKTLRFPPLVIASSSLLCAWAHLGRAEALALHLPLLSAHCRASVHDLTQCQRVLHAYFKKTFPQKAAEAAERLRHQAELAACRSGACDSPDTVMAASFTGAPASGGAVDAADEGGEGAEELPREILPQGGAAVAGGAGGAALEAPLFAHDAAAPCASGSRRHDAKRASPAVR